MRLYPYQKVGRDDLAAHRRRYLGDDPGLGKTVMALAAAEIVDAQRLLVICPAIARPVWRRTWEQMGRPTPQCHMVSYDECRMGRAPDDPDLVILDEAHYCANIAAKRTRAALRVAHQAPRVWCLSGTPMRNHPLELYPVLRAIWPDLLNHHGVGTREKYLARFCTVVPTEWGEKILPEVKAPEVLRQIVGSVMLRRRLSDVQLDLPPLRWESTPLLAPDGPTLDEMLAGIAGYDVLLAALECGELPEGGQTSTLRRLIGAAKAPAALALLADELREGTLDKVVVLAYHRDVLDLLHRGLAPFGVVRVEGSTAPGARERAEERFQTEHTTRVFLGQITAAGTAITLTAGHEIVLVEQMWTPFDNFQAVKRIHRIGQDYPCRARLCMLPDTIDEQVERVLLRKLAAIGEIIHL
jgi:SNF2 family DNA or RNA helicase